MAVTKRVAMRARLKIGRVPRWRIRIALRTVAVVAAAAMFCGACSFIPRETFTASEEAIAEVPGFPHVRFYADAPSRDFQSFVPADRLGAAIREAGGFDVLALSGGAYDGAYGAGIVNGWTEAGTRPRFTIVTGVSAGALIAPAAFLGPAFDPAIKQAFTVEAAQVLGDLGGALSLLGSADLRRNTVVELISKFVDERFLAAIAVEHARGRRLFVVTTNLDAQRAVVWDMGAIASTRHPGALQLFKDVLTASASIPGVFAPTLIEVEARGRRFREMHVDGGATAQVFILPDAILITGMGAVNPGKFRARIWVIINNHLTPEFQVVEDGLLTTAGRSFSTLIKNSAKSTLVATQAFVGRKNFNLTYIDGGFDEVLKTRYASTIEPGFNTPYLDALFAYGVEKVRSGRAFEHEVPLPDGSALQSRVLARR